MSSAYLIRDRDGAYGAAFIRRIRAMGTRDRWISARLIGSIRRECLDHVVVVRERHLPRVLASYQKYYNEVRTHLSLQKDAPVRRDEAIAGGTDVVRLIGQIGRLHRQVERAPQDVCAG
jgi:hypothetical protein